MTATLEKRLDALENKVVHQAALIQELQENLEESLEERWAIDAINTHDTDEETVPAFVVEALLRDQNPIKIYREHRGLTQAALAKACDTSTAYISQLETGNRKAGADILLALAKALNTDPEDLIWDTPPDTA